MRSVYRAALLLAGLAAALALPAWPAESPAQSSPFGEEIDVRVVNVEAVVTDRDGHRVTGLKPEDFRLRVDGKEVPVEYFSEVRDGNALPPPAPAGESPAEKPAEVQGLTEGPVGTYYLVFIDDYFSIASQRSRVLQTLKADLGRLGPEDRMAIVTYDGGRLVLLSNWSSSREELARALDQASARPSHGLERVVEARRFKTDQDLSRAVADVVRAQGENYSSPGIETASPVGALGPTATTAAEQMDYAENLVRQLQGDVQAVVGAMRGLSGPRGRKVLLLLSGGWPFSVQTVTTGGTGMPRHELPEGDVIFGPLARTANLLGYTIYPIEVREAALAGADVEAVGPNSDPFSSIGSQEIEGSLYYLAKETGGRPLLHGNREMALAQAQEDTRSFYWLGFSPSWQRDDKPHQIRVEARRPGLSVRSRTGFLDLSRKAEVSMKVESALLFGNPPSGLSMPITLGTPVRSKRGELQIPVTLALPVDVMTPLQEGGKYTVHLELRFAASDASGSSSEIPVVPVTLTSAQLPRPGRMVRYETKLTLRGKADHLVAAVYDPLSGKLATAEADVKGP